ncbi:MAG: BglG family transcription antiterminator [Clostridiales bacterium]|nr:BglG family transcription antiterminator [Clostridiales bacterium]
MTNREIMGLYSMLLDGEYITAETIAQTLHVSSRTVRNQMKNLNSVLSSYDIVVESKHGVGYRMIAGDAKKRREFEEMLWDRERQHTVVPNSSGERVAYLTDYLLKEDEYVRLDDLSDLLYISKKTLTGNLKEVESLLGEYRLTLSRKPNHGLKVEGSEFDRRLCIAEISRTRQAPAWQLWEEHGQNEKKQWIEDCIHDCLSRYPYIIANIAYQDLVLHIEIAVRRMLAGHYIENSEGESVRITDPISWQMAGDILSAIAERYPFRVLDGEIESVALHLEAKKTLQDVLPEDSQGDYVVVSEEIDELIECMLSSVYSAFRFDFSSDLELAVMLRRHLVPMIVRLQHGMRISNPLLTEIRQQYALAFTMATTACMVLNHKYHTVVREDEIGYIALLFALALERKRTEIAKKNILLVCASGQSSSQLLRYRYQTEFGSYINWIDVCDIGQLGSYDFSDIDYIFTTVPIPMKVPVPVQEIKYFLKSSHMSAVRRALRGSYDHTIREIYREELFLTHRDFRSKKEALRIMCDYVREHGYAGENLFPSVCAREEIARTAFGNLAAMPHPLEIMSERPFVCVALLDRPVLWIEDDPSSLVQAIFLVSVANVKNYDVQKFYQVTARLLMDESSMKELLRGQDYETLCRLLGREESRVDEEEG